MAPSKKELAQKIYSELPKLRGQYPATESGGRELTDRIRALVEDAGYAIEKLEWNIDVPIGFSFDGASISVTLELDEHIVSDKKREREG